METISSTQNRFGHVVNYIIFLYSLVNDELIYRSPNQEFLEVIDYFSTYKVFSTVTKSIYILDIDLRTNDQRLGRTSHLGNKSRW